MRLSVCQLMLDSTATTVSHVWDADVSGMLEDSTAARLGQTAKGDSEGWKGPLEARKSRS